MILLAILAYGAPVLFPSLDGLLQASQHIFDIFCISSLVFNVYLSMLAGYLYAAVLSKTQFLEWQRHKLGVIALTIVIVTTIMGTALVIMI